MFKKKIWLLAPTTLLSLPLIVACSGQKVEAFKAEDGSILNFLTNINFTLLEVKAANEATKPQNLIVGNFVATDVATELDYSFESGADADFFEVDNSTPEKLIYLKSSKFKEIIDSNKEAFNFVTKASYKGQYILQTNNIIIETETEVEPISLFTDSSQNAKPIQQLDINENFNVQVNLEARARGTVISNTTQQPNKVHRFGAVDGDQRTFYSPVDLSNAEKETKEAAGEPSSAEIIFTAKEPQGVYVSTLEAYFVANGVANVAGTSMIGVLYETIDGKIERAQKIEDSRLDMDLIAQTDPGGYQRGVRYVPIYETVKSITFVFEGQDNNGIYPYVSEIQLMGKVKTDYQQKDGTLLSDRNFATYLLSNPLSQTYNVTMIKNDKVTFEFEPSSLTKLSQIQLYKAPVAYRNDDANIRSAWKIRPGVLSKYKYVVTFADKTKVGFEISGTGWPVETFVLPEKYRDKVVLTVTLISDSIMELKEIIFA